MQTKPTIAIVALAAIIVLAVLLIAKQRTELSAIRTQIATAKNSRPVVAPAAPTRLSDTPPASTNIDGEPGTIAQTSMSEEERKAFIRHMRTLINTYDSGMSTFKPDTHYTQSLSQMSVDDLKETLADIEASEINSSDKHSLKRNIIDRLAKIDPAFVLETQHDGGSQSWRGAITASIRRLSQTDPHAARKWLDNAEWDGDPDYKKNLFEVHAAGLATGGNIRGALDALAEVDGSELAFKRVALAAKTASDRALVIDTILPEQQAGARAAFARAAHYRGGFADGKAVFDEQFPNIDDEGRSSAMLELATETFDDGDVPTSAEWVLAQSRDGDRVKNIEGFVGEWVSRDYNGAAKWIGQMEAGAERNAAIAVLVGKVREFDPSGAAAWAKEITP